MIGEDDFSEHLDDGIDLTPVIDVVFLLLIFFIMATTFSRPVLDVVLPTAESSDQPAPGRRETLVVIDAQGRMFHQGQELNADGLDALLSRDVESPLNFHVDKRAPFEAFMTVLDNAKSKGRDNFVITTLHADRQP